MQAHRAAGRGDFPPTLPEAGPSRARRASTARLGFFLAVASAERDGGLLGQDQEGEALLDIEPHALAVVVEIADREVLADRQLEITAAHRDHQATVEAGRPHDLAVDQPPDVAQDRVAAVVAGGRRGNGVARADLALGIIPAHRTAKIAHAASRQYGAQRALGFLFDLRPAGFGDRRLIAEKMILRHLDTCSFAIRKLPMPKLPSELMPSPLSPDAPACTISASISVIGPSVNRKVFRCCINLGSLRRSHSSTIEACSFSSSRL